MRIKEEENFQNEFRRDCYKFTKMEAHNITGLDAFEERTHEPK